MVIKSPLEILQNDESAKNNGYTVVYLNLPESQKEMILSILVDTFISKISFPMQPGPEIGSISDA